jgi:hypothetical protein
MKKFLLRVCVFLLIYIFISLILANFYILQTKKNVLLNESISNVVLGDSHAQVGINDNLFDEECFNWANSGENYFHCYCKLNYLFRNKVEIENVILTYGPHNLDKKIDSLWVYNKDNFLGKIRVYSPFISFPNLNEFIIHTPFSNFIYIEVIPEILYQSYYSIERQLLMSEFVYSGGFEPTSTILNDTITIKSDPIKITQTSEIQIFYLNKIIKLCEQNNVKLYLVNMPLFNGENVITPATNNSNYTLFDYGAHFKGQNKLFADLVHLNTTGADEFTKLLIQDLKNRNE